MDFWSFGQTTVLRLHGFLADLALLATLRATIIRQYTIKTGIHVHNIRTHSDLYHLMNLPSWDYCMCISMCVYGCRNLMKAEIGNMSLLGLYSVKTAVTTCMFTLTSEHYFNPTYLSYLTPLTDVGMGAQGGHAPLQQVSNKAIAVWWYVSRIRRVRFPLKPKRKKMEYLITHVPVHMWSSLLERKWLAVASRSLALSLNPRSR